MGLSIVKVAAGGLPVTIAATGGLPCTEATNGFGIAVTEAPAGTGGLAVTGFTFGPTIALSASSVLETAAINTTVGTLSVTTGTTGTPVFTLADSAGGKFNISGTTLRTNALLDYETATFHTITIAVSGVTPSVPNRTVPIIVLNVPEVTLAALTLSNNDVSESDVAGTVVGAIVGKTSGSSLSLIDSDSGRYAISGTNLVVGTTALVAGTDSVTIRETHSDGSNSPRDTVLSVDVAAPLLAAPGALVLTWVSGPADNTPEIEALGDIVEGDVIRFQFDTVNTFDSGDLVASTNTVDAAEDLAEEIMFTIGALADDTWFARARIERPGHENSAWSNIVSETIVTTPAGTTLNPLDKSTFITLSPDNLTATSQGGVGATSKAVRATVSKTTGKYFCKFTIVEFGTNGTQIGICNAAKSLETSALGSQDAPAHGCGFVNNGYIVYDNGTFGGFTYGPISTWVVNDVISMAVDLTAERIWFRRNSGNWNDNASADPATGTGGYDISGAIQGDAFFPAISFLSEIPGTGEVTADFSGTGAPSGFSAW